MASSTNTHMDTCGLTWTTCAPNLGASLGVIVVFGAFRPCILLFSGGCFFFLDFFEGAWFSSFIFPLWAWYDHIVGCLGCDGAPNCLLVFMLGDVGSPCYTPGFQLWSVREHIQPTLGLRLTLSERGLPHLNFIRIKPPWRIKRWVQNQKD